MDNASALILGTVWPEPTSSAAGIRDVAIVRALQAAGWKVVYASASQKNDFSAALDRMGVCTRLVAANDPGFDAFIAELRPTVAIFDRFMTEEQFGWRVRDHSPATVRVLDTIDLHFLRRARKAALEAGAPLEAIFSGEIDLHTEDALREIASIYRCDLSLILSSFELELLTDRLGVPASLLELAAFAYPAPERAAPGFAERDGFCVIGNFRHAPNADGAFWLKRELWPRIRALLPAAVVHVYGAYPPRKIMALHAPGEGFLVEGPAPDQYEVMRRHRVNLAPLRFGAGIKGKIADGWLMGAPAVSTPIGSEGMEALEGGPWGGSIAHDPEAFARAAVGLHSDAELWEKAREQGFKILEERFSAEHNDRALVTALEEACKHVSRRRRANFTGQMLWHHQHRSTTYFSKWIEAKNQGRAPAP